MHDGMQYDPIQGQGQGHEPFKFPNPAVFKSYLLCHLQKELATDHGFLNWGTISTFSQTELLMIFGLVFVSRDFEVGTNVSCKESTVSPHTGLILLIYYLFSALATPRSAVPALAICSSFLQ